MEDENDVLPVFSAARWHVELEEGVPPGTVLALLTVEDDDVTNQFSYRVSDVFQIHSKDKYLF